MAPTDRAQDPERVNRDFWDEDADDYQAVHGAHLGTGLRWGAFQLPEADVGVLGDVAGLDVLELGCGAAQWSIGLAAVGARTVALDQSRGQLRHARRRVAEEQWPVALVAASGTATPFADASFDLVMCDHGAMSFCDPRESVPEVARVLRPGGRLVFSIGTLLLNTCYPSGDTDAGPGRRLERPMFGRTLYDWGEGTIDFQLLHGEWIRLFRAHGLVVEDLVALRPPKGATTTYTGFVDRRWARRWPAEEVWVVRKDVG